MGNNNSQLSLWEAKLKDLTSGSVSCRESCLINPETSKEYFLKTCMRTNSFLATAEDGDFQVNIISCPTFQQTKSATHMAKKLASIRNPLIEEVLEYFSFMETGVKKVSVAVVMHSRPGVNVDEWVSTCKNGLQLEALLEGFFEGLEMMRSLHAEGVQLNLISTHNVIIYKENERLTYRIKFLTDYIDPSQRPPEAEYKTPQGDVWAAGYVFFTLLTGIPVAQSKLGLKVEHERLTYIRQRVNDIALTEVISMCFFDESSRKSCEEILSHRYVRWWRQPKTTELRLDMMQAVSTQLKCSTLARKNAAIEAFFVLATFDSAVVFSYIQLQSYEWERFIAVFTENEHSASVAEGALLLFVAAIRHAKGARRLMFRGGMVENLLRRESNLAFGSVMAFFVELCQKSTCTLPVLLYERKIPGKALKAYPTCANSQNFILNSAPMFGNYAAKFILTVYEGQIWTCHQAVEQLLKVPFHNLTPHKHSVLSLIEKSVDALLGGRLNVNSSLLNLMRLLSTITSVTEVFEIASQRGSCLRSPEFAFAEELVRCPLVVFCADCAISICVYCGATCHSSCKLRPLFPQSTYMSCKCPEKHQDNPCLYPVFNIKKRASYILKPSKYAHIETADTTMYRICCTSFYGEPVTVVSAESLVPERQWEKTSATAFYFEVKILSSGPRDALSVGLEGLEYLSWNGQIVDSAGHVLLRSVPYGSHDSVGVGITHDSRAYFTLNGLMIHPLLPLTTATLKLGFYSEDASVLLILDTSRCLFQPKDASLLENLRLRAAQSIPKSLNSKLERLLLENYSMFEDERRLDELLMFLSRQFGGQVGRKVLAKANRASAWGDASCSPDQCVLL